MAIIYGITDSERRFLKKLPDEVKTIGDIPRVYQKMKQEFDSIENKGLSNKLKRWSKKREINKIEKNKGSPLYRGAKGELTVLEKLSELDDNYHVLCGVRIDLGRFVTYPYRRKKNLRSAQMDFVVVSKRGVVLIEAKNWSDEYLSKNREHGGIIPHEQVDRAGLVLYIALSSWLNLKNPPVSKVVLATHGNMQYDPRYEFVNVKDLNNINYFIQTRHERFPDEIVQRVVDFLIWYELFNPENSKTSSSYS